MAFNFNVNDILNSNSALGSSDFENTLNFNESDSQDFIVDTQSEGGYNLPVYAPLILEPLKQPGFDLPELRIDAVKVSLNRSKNIQKTSIEGKDITIKEHIANGDFSISIDGMIASEKGSAAYPKAKLFLLKQFLNAPYTLKVTHAILNRFGVYELVIDSYSIPAIDGTKNIQRFSASATSDETVELIIKNNA